MSGKIYKKKPDQTAEQPKKSKDLAPADLSTRRLSKQSVEKPSIKSFTSDADKHMLFLPKSSSNLAVPKNNAPKSINAEQQSFESFDKHHKSGISDTSIAKKSGKYAAGKEQNEDAPLFKSYNKRSSFVNEHGATPEPNMLKAEQFLSPSPEGLKSWASPSGPFPSRTRSFQKSSIADSLRNSVNPVSSQDLELEYKELLAASPSFASEKAADTLKSLVPPSILLDSASQADDHKVSSEDIRSTSKSSEGSPVDINRKKSFRKSNISESIQARRNSGDDKVNSGPANRDSIDVAEKKKNKELYNSQSSTRPLPPSAVTDSLQKKDLIEKIKIQEEADIVKTKRGALGDIMITVEEPKTEQLPRRARKYDNAWMLVVCNIKLSKHLINSFKKCADWADKIVKIPVQDDGHLSFNMKMYKSEADATLSKKMSVLLARNTIRSRDSINELDKILKYRLPSYAAFSLEKRMKLCKIMQFESYPEGKLVCKEGQRAENFYFILSGKIEITLIKDTTRTRVNVMNTGESLGRIQLVSDIRMASIATMMPTELLCINKREFASVSDHVLSPDELNEQTNALRALPHFASRNDFLENSKGNFEITVYSNGDVVLMEGDVNDRLYFILSGKCRCSKKVPFIGKKNSTNKDLTAYEPSKILLPNEEVLQVTLDIQELESSDHFPGIPPESNKIKEILSVDTEKAMSMLRGYVGNSSTDNDVSLAQFSVIATSRSEIASISKIDYISAATPDMLAETLMQKNMYSVSIREVQEAFLDQQKWKSYKKNLVAGVGKG